MDIALKQRLVGASVLIAVAVVVLPMLLGGRPREGEPETRKIEIPPQPAELDFQTRRYPVGEASLQSPAPDQEGAPGSREVAHVELEKREFRDALANAPAAEPTADEAAGNTAGASGSAEAAAGTETPGAEVTQAPAAEPPAPAAKSPQLSSSPPKAAVGGRYVVQVASFSSVDNAAQLSAKLRDFGYRVLSDTVKSEVGTLHRVRVGPYAAEAEASQAAARLRNQFSDVRPRIMDLQPDMAAQVTTPSDPLVRWVVQVGSFASVGNADKLVERLRAEGLSAYREEVSSSGSTIYRVRVGPFLEREEAIRVDARVNDRLQLDGVVMSAD